MQPYPPIPTVKRLQMTCPDPSDNNVQTDFRADAKPALSSSTVSGGVRRRPPATLQPLHHKHALQSKLMMPKSRVSGLLLKTAMPLTQLKESEQLPDASKTVGTHGYGISSDFPIGTSDINADGFDLESDGLAQRNASVFTDTEEGAAQVTPQ